jgi:hypothetical protein
LIVATVAVSATLGLAGPAAADDWPPALGAGLAIGGGARTPPGDERGGLFELAPRVELLWGDKRAFGPSVAFRTATFRTAELYAGLTAAFSDGNFGWLLSGEGGYAWRDGDRNGAMLAGTAGWGLVGIERGWAPSTVIYISFHHAVTSRDEVTGGISFGGGILDFLPKLVRF